MSLARALLSLPRQARQMRLQNLRGDPGVFQRLTCGGSKLPTRRSREGRCFKRAPRKQAFSVEVAQASNKMVGILSRVPIPGPCKIAKQPFPKLAARRFGAAVILGLPKYEMSHFLHFQKEGSGAFCPPGSFHSLIDLFTSLPHA